MTNTRRFPVLLTPEEMEYIHETLVAVKSADAREGRPYSRLNARVRTEMEEHYHSAKTQLANEADLAELQSVIFDRK